jgi:hypothetical protein
VSRFKLVLWGLLQTIIVIIICGLALLAAAQLQQWEASNDGFLDDLVLLLVFGVAALISGTAVLAYPVYLVLKQRIREGYTLLISTIIWLVLLLGCALIGIVFLDIHTIFV